MKIYRINTSICTFCGGCSSVCPSFAVTIRDDAAEITKGCVLCGACKKFCPVDAVIEEQV